MELPIEEIALINISIEFEFALASLLTVLVVASVLNLVVLPLFGALAVILIVEPLAIVHGPVHADENTLAASLSFLPLSVVNLAVLMLNSSFSMEEPLVSHALVD